MSQPQAKTLCEMIRFCVSCDKDCIIERLEGENKKLVISSNEALSYIKHIENLEGRLEAIQQHYENFVYPVTNNAFTENWLRELGVLLKPKKSERPQALSGLRYEG